MAKRTINIDKKYRYIKERLRILRVLSDFRASAGYSLKDKYYEDERYTLRIIREQPSLYVKVKDKKTDKKYVITRPLGRIGNAYTVDRSQ